MTGFLIAWTICGLIAVVGTILLSMFIAWYVYWDDKASLYVRVKAPRPILRLHWKTWKITNVASCVAAFVLGPIGLVIWIATVVMGFAACIAFLFLHSKKTLGDIYKD